MSLIDKLLPIKCFVFDLDGVLTDGTVYVFNDGEQVRRMSIKDGYALQLAIKKGYRIVVISGSHSEGVIKRLGNLGVTDVYMKITDKLQQLEAYMQQHALESGEILFMGDDIPDLEVMKLAGCSAAPADAAHEVRHAADYISPCNGGMGCVREVIQKVLQLKGDWELHAGIPSR